MTITIPIAAVGKPRMTQRDKWKQRPVIMRYRAFADFVRMHTARLKIPPAEKVDLISVLARYQTTNAKKNPPGSVKRTKPDGDNVLKSVCDILWPDNDAALGDAEVQRRWWTHDELVIAIYP